MQYSKKIFKNNSNGNSLKFKCIKSEFENMKLYPVQNKEIKLLIVEFLELKTVIMELNCAVSFFIFFLHIYCIIYTAKLMVIKV